MGYGIITDCEITGSPDQTPPNHEVRQHAYDLLHAEMPFVYIDHGTPANKYKVTIDINKKNKLTVQFHDCAGNLLLSARVKNPHFYVVAKDYRSAVQKYFKTLAADDPDPNEIEDADDARKSFHTAGTEALLEEMVSNAKPHGRHIEFRGGESCPKARSLFYLCAFAIRHRRFG